MPTYTRDEIIKDPPRWQQVAPWFLPVLVGLVTAIMWIGRKG
jgi:hypothetical protein